MNTPIRRHADAWTYHDFGARSLRDEIIALVLHEFDQTVDDRTVVPDLIQESFGLELPVVPVAAQGIPLEDQAADAKAIQSEKRVLFAHYGHEDAVAVTYLSEHPELLTKIRKAIAGQIALDLVDAVFSSRISDGRVPIPADPGKVVISLPPD